MEEGAKVALVIALSGAIAFGIGLSNSSVTGLRIFGGFGLIGLIMGVAIFFDRL